MDLRDDEHRTATGIPVQRTPLTRAAPADSVVPDRAGELIPARLPPARPTAADVAIGAVTLTVGAARSVADVGLLVGQRTLDWLPVPAAVRRRIRGVWRASAYAGVRERAEARRRLAALLDRAVPLLAREVLARIDLTRLVKEFVDLDALAAGLDVDAVVDRVDLDRAVTRLDIDRILDRIDLDEVVARVDLDRILGRVDLNEQVDRVDLDRAVGRVDLDRVVDRVDLDRAVGRVDLDRVVDRVDLDRAAARLDLDPILDRADVVGLARYVIDAIDLPGIIRSSTGSMTSDLVHGVRAQGADADEAVQRVVDRLLRRRRRDDLAPGGER